MTADMKEARELAGEIRGIGLRAGADLVERLAAELETARKDAERWRSMYRAAVQVGAELETTNGNMRRALDRFKLLVDDRGVEWVSFFGETVHCRVQLLNVAPDLQAGIKQAVQCAMRASAP